MRWVAVVACLLIGACSRQVDLQDVSLSRQQGTLHLKIGPTTNRTKFAYLRVIPCGGDEASAHYVVIGDIELAGATNIALSERDSTALARHKSLCAQVFDRSTPLIRYTSKIVTVREL